MKSDIVEAFAQMAKLKSIDRDILESIIKDSFRKMMEKRHGPEANFDVIVNMEKGNIEIISRHQFFNNFMNALVKRIHICGLIHRL